MDQLAKEGMRFTDAHTPASVCTPTRYAVLTGRYTWRSRLKGGILRHYSPMLIEKDRLTVGSLLQQNGYYTACIGKWHLGFTDNKEGADFSGEITGRMPVDVGFDYFFGSAGTPWNSMPFYTSEGKMHGDIKQPDDPRMRISCLFIEQRKPLPEMEVDHKKIFRIIREKSVEVIENHAANNSKKPLFLYLALSSPHKPHIASYETEGKTIGGPRTDMVMDVDLTVKAVMDALERNGMATNTLLFATSDNGASPAGEEKGKHQGSFHWRSKKASAFEGGHRVPFIACWPGRIPAGVVSDEIVCLVDLMGTCADILDITLPADAGEDSYSILPALLNEPLDAPIREATVHHAKNGKVFAIRQGPWKLIDAPYGGGFGENEILHPKGLLFNLEEDPKEEHNVYDDYPEVADRLRTLLNGYKTAGRSVRQKN
jgi:arylsulfatase A-like enzyme